MSNLITTVNLSINDKFRIVNPNYFVKGQINNLRLEHKKVTSIKKFLPSYNSKFILKNTEINFVSTRKESPSKLKLKGLINFDKDFCHIQNICWKLYYIYLNHLT